MQERIRIAVAYDDAFCFYYRTSLEALRKAGAKLLFFSPIEDKTLPSGISGLYLGGGYPELFLSELSSNESMRKSILSALSAGLPAIAECGGFMYLHSGIFDISGKYYEMAGFIDGNAYYTGALKRFGYIWLSSEKDSMLFKRGERIPAHEFHYYESTVLGEDLIAIKARALDEKEDDNVGNAGDIRETDNIKGAGGIKGRENFGEIGFTKQITMGYSNEALYAGFPHLELSGELPLAERFIEKAREYLGNEQA